MRLRAIEMTSALLATDRLTLVGSGDYFRRCADFRVNDAASQTELGKITERTPSLIRRFPLGRLEALRHHDYDVVSEAGEVVAVAHSRVMLLHVRGDVLDGNGAILGSLRQRRTGDWFPVEIKGKTDRFPAQFVRQSWKSETIEMRGAAGEIVAEAAPTGTDEHRWRTKFSEYRLEFDPAADQVQRLIVLGAIPILHMTYIAPRQ